MRVIIDRDVCIGSGNCMRFAPDVFDQDADAIVVLKLEEPPAGLVDDVRNAVAGCPTGAIQLVEH